MISKLYIESIEPTTTRKRFSSQKKEVIKHFYLAWGNYRETARAFQFQNSTVRKICKAAPPKKSESHQCFKGGKGWKGNNEDAGRPLLYPASTDEELLNSFHISITEKSTIINIAKQSLL